MDAAGSQHAVAGGRTILRRTVKPCGPDTPTLVSRSRRSFASRGQWWPKSPAHQGEHGAAVKTIARGGPDDRLVPVVLPGAFCCTRTAGAVGTRPSPCPLDVEGGLMDKTRARGAAGRISHNRSSCPAQAGHPVRRSLTMNHCHLWNTGSPAFAGDDSGEEGDDGGNRAMTARDTAMTAELAMTAEDKAMTAGGGDERRSALRIGTARPPLAKLRQAGVSALRRGAHHARRRQAKPQSGKAWCPGKDSNLHGR